MQSFSQVKEPKSSAANVKTTTHNDSLGKEKTDIWRAYLELEFKRSSQGITTLALNRHEGPLMVQKPFYPEKACHIYMLHPPGGIASCDELNVKVNALKGTKVLITTPGATKYYKTDSRRSSVRQDIYVDEDASVEFLPAQNIFYKGTRTKVCTSIYLTGNASFSFRDISKFGIKEEDFPFDNSSYLNVIRIIKDGKLVFKESTLIDGNDDYSGIASMNSNPYVGTFICSKVSESTMEGIEKILESENFTASAGIINNFTVIRFLGAKNEPIENAIVQIWALTRKENVSLSPCYPRIWST